jgi:phage terminase large subunit
VAEISFEYEPRDHFIPFHQRSKRWSCLVVHRRGGKTVACVNDLIARALYTKKKDARFAYIAPFYRQAKDIAWTYLKDYAKQAIVKIRESELRVELVNGSWITLYGADNPDALRGIYLDGVILDEYGDCRPSLWGEVILPTLTDRRGWAVFIGTPKGKNHFYEIFRRSQSDPDWYSLHLPVHATSVFPTKELKEIEQQQTDEEYEQEFLCSFEAAVRGTYYADMLNELGEDQISSDLDVQSDLPVHVATDLGYTDSTALWFWQLTPDGPLLIDYDEFDQKPLNFYFSLLNEKPFANLYETIWLPHDARAKSFQTGRSTIEQFLNHYRDTEIDINIAPKLSRQDGINAVRFLLPRCHFRLPHTYPGLEALRNYKRQYNETTKAYSDNPAHDWTSHGADAFRYFALVTREKYVKASTSERKKAALQIQPPKYTLDKLWEEQAKIINLAGRRI